MDNKTHNKIRHPQRSYLVNNILKIADIADRLLPDNQKVAHQDYGDIRRQMGDEG